MSSSERCTRGDESDGKKTTAAKEAAVACEVLYRFRERPLQVEPLRAALPFSLTVGQIFQTV
jgi:hypothetical protein